MIGILLVDDQTIVREGVKGMLAGELDIRVTGEAPTGRSALEQVPCCDFDLVLLDISLPDQSGIQVLRQLRAQHPSLPVVMLTGHSEPQFSARALGLGAAGYVTKDRIDEDLVATIRTAMAGHSVVLRPPAASGAHRAS